MKRVQYSRPHCDLLTYDISTPNAELIIVITGDIELEQEAIEYALPSWTTGEVTKLLRTPVSKEYVWNHNGHTVTGTVYRIKFSVGKGYDVYAAHELVIANIRYLLRSPVTNLSQFFAVEKSADGVFAGSPLDSEVD